MAGHFETLLHAIVERPDHPVSTLPLMSSAEQQQLQAWNQTGTDYPQDLTVVDLFEQQVAATQNHIAVVYDEQRLTYWQLNDRANQLAHTLINDHHIQADVLVGICVERSLEMIIGLLGILKAGGAYVPIDPNYPPERIQFILSDSAAPVLLTQTGLKESLSLSVLPSSCQVLCLDQETFASQPVPSPNPTGSSHSEGLAYVIYTSGSTGQPKGVMVEHSNLVTSTLARHAVYHERDMRLLLFPSFAFDAFAAGVCMTLSTGGTLHLPDAERANDIEHALSIMQTYEISHLMCPPPLYLALLNHTSSLPLSVKTVSSGGEVPSQELLQQHAAKAPLANLFNEYGPTEATIWSTVHPYQSADEQPNNIGQPIANTRIYILDAENQPLPPGIPGELCIAGAGLARGYLNRPELTAEKFIDLDLLGHHERVYKTGDLARWSPDGHIEFMGRIDNQVKLRGFRIELGEIETILSQHESVKEAVVTLYEADSNQRLVAYVTGDSTAEMPEVLKHDLKARLPNYMVPSQIVVLDALPLNANSKIDREALPAPEGGVKGWYEAPRNQVEQRLAEVWSAVLKRQDIGIHDDFFDLGGAFVIGDRAVEPNQSGVSRATPIEPLLPEPDDCSARRSTRQF